MTIYKVFSINKIIEYYSSYIYIYFKSYICKYDHLEEVWASLMRIELYYGYYLETPKRKEWNCRPQTHPLYKPPTNLNSL